MASGRRTSRSNDGRHRPSYHLLGVASITPYVPGQFLNSALIMLYLACNQAQQGCCWPHDRTPPPSPAAPRHGGHRGRAAAQHPGHRDQARSPLVPVRAPLRVAPPVRPPNPMGTIRTHVRFVAHKPARRAPTTALFGLSKGRGCGRSPTPFSRESAGPGQGTSSPCSACRAVPIPPRESPPARSPATSR